MMKTFKRLIIKTVKRKAILNQTKRIFQIKKTFTIMMMIINIKRIKSVMKQVSK
jgi:hypothetical protein